MVRIVTALSGRGLLLGVRLLQALKTLGVETHLVLDTCTDEEVSKETGLSRGQVCSLAARVHDNRDLAAPIASGSYPTDGMIIAPCSLNRIIDLAQGFSEDLIGRAADVTLKEGRTLVISPTETPLSEQYIRSLLLLAEAGARIVPAIPTFYTSVEGLNENIDQIAGRILDRFALKHRLYKPWGVE